MIYIITGSTSGLGLKIALRLCKKDKDEVIGVSRSMDIPYELSKYKKNYRHCAIDLSDDSRKVRKAFEDLISTVNSDEKITLIINAAKFIVSDMVLEPEESVALFNSNYFNATVLVKSLLSLKLRRVLFINSISGLVAQQNQYDYSASKHALQSFSDTLSISAKKFKFDVMTINPGGINTELWDKANISPPVERFMDPVELSELIVFLLHLKGRYFIKNFVILPEIDV
jgi:NAD(P)-dependent dehydrogenase (short-subunit alcohol dehydrogenase family)